MSVDDDVNAKAKPNDSGGNPELAGEGAVRRWPKRWDCGADAEQPGRPRAVRCITERDRAPGNGGTRRAAPLRSLERDLGPIPLGVSEPVGVGFPDCDQTAGELEERETETFADQSADSLTRIESRMPKA